MLRSRRLTRHVFAQLFVPTLLGLLLFTFVLLMNHLLLVAQKAITMNLEWAITLRLFAYELPKLLVMTIPMGTLLGTLIAVGRISADHEWVAMQSAGLGPWSLIRPVALFGLLAAAVSFACYVWVFPRTNFAIRQLQGRIAATATLSSNIRPGVFHTTLPEGIVLFVEDVRPAARERLRGVLVHRANAPGGDQQLILARRGDLYPSRAKDGSLEVVLREGVTFEYRPDRPEEVSWSPHFASQRLRLPPPPFVLAFQQPRQKTLLDMELRELWREAEQAQTLEEPVLRELRLRSVWREIHSRFALPGAALLFAVLAVPMGITRVRSGKAAGFALACLVIIVYWLTYTFARDRGDRGEIPIAVGVWAANGAIVLWILAAYWRMRRRSAGGRPLRGAVRMIWRPVRGGLERRRRPSAPRENSAAAEAEAPPISGSVSHRIVSLLDRYVALSFVRILLLALGSIYVIYLIVELKGVLDSALQNQQPLSLVFAYLRYFLPGALKVVLPVACLVAAVVTYTLLARSGELTAVLTTGTSLPRTTAPVIWLTVLLCAGFFLVENNVTPAANARAQELKDQIRGQPPRSYGAGPGGRWTYGHQGRLYHYGLYDPRNKSFQGLSVFQVDRANQRVLSYRYAPRAQWDEDGWRLGEGWLCTLPEGGNPMISRFEGGLKLALDPPENFSERELLLAPGGDVEEGLTLGELREQIRSLEAKGYDTTRFRVAYQNKLATPATPLVMVLLGLPFAFRIGRRGSLYGIGVALILVIVYWATFAVFRALGLETLLPPVLAAWAPSVFFFLLGLYLMLYVRT